MVSMLFYTSPARGHLFPILGAALELHSRVHEVHVRTLSSETERVRKLGLHAEPIAPEIEARELDDWKGNSPGDLQPFSPVHSERHAEHISDQQVDHSGDNEHHQYVENESGAGHFGDADQAAAIHDGVGRSGYRQHERTAGANGRRDYKQQRIMTHGYSYRSQDRQKCRGRGCVTGYLRQEDDHEQ